MYTVNLLEQETQREMRAVTEIASHCLQVWIVFDMFCLNYILHDDIFGNLVSWPTAG